MTEMICTSADGRITPGCGGLYRDEHVPAWKRIVDFVHTHSRSAIGAQLGHAGRKGSTQAAVGRRERAAARGQLAADRAVADPVGGRRQPGPARDDPRGHGRREGRLRGLHGACGGGRLRPARDPHGPRLPALELPLAADQRARRRVRGGPGEVPARGLRRVPRGVAGRAADERAHQRHRLGRWRLRRRRRGGLRAPPGGGGLRHRRRLHGPGLARPEARLRALLPDPLRRPDPPRGGHPGDRRRRDLQLRRRQHDHPRRPRRPVRARAPAPVGPALDPARRRRPGRRDRLDPAVPLRFEGAQHRQGRAADAAAALRVGVPA